MRTNADVTLTAICVISRVILVLIVPALRRAHSDSRNARSGRSLRPGDALRDGKDRIAVVTYRCLPAILP